MTQQRSTRSLSSFSRSTDLRRRPLLALARRTARKIEATTRGRSRCLRNRKVMEINLSIQHYGVGNMSLNIMDYLAQDHLKAQIPHCWLLKVMKMKSHKPACQVNPYTTWSRGRSPGTKVLSVGCSGLIHESGDPNDSARRARRCLPETSPL